MTTAGLPFLAKQNLRPRVSWPRARDAFAAAIPRQCKTRGNRRLPPATTHECSLPYDASTEASEIPRVKSAYGDEARRATSRRQQVNAAPRSQHPLRQSGAGWRQAAAGGRDLRLPAPPSARKASFPVKWIFKGERITLGPRGTARNGFASADAGARASKIAYQGMSQRCRKRVSSRVLRYDLTSFSCRWTKTG
jgi:hypothetical protein